MDGLVLFPRLDLAGIEFAAVEDHPLHQTLVGRQLNLNVVNRPRAIDRLDIENREFVVDEILEVEGVIKGNLDDRLSRLEDRAEH